MALTAALVTLRRTPAAIAARLAFVAVPIPAAAPAARGTADSVLNVLVAHYAENGE
jgi:hypothetical protein